jgi:hypothetical protein
LGVKFVSHLRIGTIGVIFENKKWRYQHTRNIEVLLKSRWYQIYEYIKGWEKPLQR